MEFHQLRYFLAVARSGSFVRAAEEEGVAQPSLSQQIKKLESEVGSPLFDRLGRTVKLTCYGEALLPHAEAVLRKTAEARKALDALHRPDAGKLVVGAIPTILPYTMVEPVAAFQRDFPRVDLQLTERTTENLVEGLRSGEIDLAILALPIRHPEIVCADLYREAILVALPQGHPAAAAGPPVPVSVLRGERMLLLREGHCLRDQVLTVCARNRVQFEHAFESDHLTSILAMVASGFGASLVPESAARHASGCALLPTQPATVRRVGYAQAAGHHSTPLQKRFIQWLRRWPWRQSVRME
ncbi:MAG: LysR family transcriptional regulator [Bryobacterales bacterium]|nr:LysR family transcriptional regulator [Bryobacterales bacterium]